MLRPAVMQYSVSATGHRSLAVTSLSALVVYKQVLACILSTTIRHNLLLDRGQLGTGNVEKGKFF